jgi:hypothetical protein
MNTSSKPSLDTHNALRTQQIRYIGDKFDKLISAIFRNEKINITKN